MKLIILKYILTSVFLLSISYGIIGQSDFNKEYNNAQDDTTRLSLIFKYATEHYQSNIDSLAILNQLALSILENTEEKITVETKERIANLSYSANDYENAAKLYAQIGTDQSITTDISKQLTYNSLAAYAYSMAGDHKNAIALNLKVLENIDDKMPKDILAQAYIYAAFVYRNSGDIVKAENYFEKCLEASDPEDKDGYYHVALHEKGNLYILQGDYRKALKFQFEALKIRRKLELTSYLIFSFHDLSITYSTIPMEDSVRFYLTKAIALEKENEQSMLPNSYLGMADSYLRVKNYNMTKTYIDSSLSYALKFKIKPQLNAVYLGYSILFDSIGEYQNAYKYYKLAREYGDSIANEDIAKQINLMNIKYETTKKDKELIKNQSRIQKQRVIIFSCLIGLIITVSLILFIIRLNRKLRNNNKLLIDQKNEIQQKNEEIKASNEEILAQADKLQHAFETLVDKNLKIEEQNKNITESITYAQRIQSALLPSNALFTECFKQNFIFFLPRDIVSGDFFWIKKINHKIMFALADCTGHGVPGAFVSILGISMLNEISRSEVNKASEWLEILRKELNHALGNDQHNKQIDDGMDMAFCIYDPATKHLNYAGAYLPVIILREQQIFELPTTRQPIGKYPNEKPFDNMGFQLQSGDQIYLFTDGIIDQFGGNSNYKFKKSRFKDAIISISDLSFKEKRNALLSIFESWKQNFKQLDDITVIGIGIE